MNTTIPRALLTTLERVYTRGVRTFVLVGSLIPIGCGAAPSAEDELPAEAIQAATDGDVSLPPLVCPATLPTYALNRVYDPTNSLLGCGCITSKGLLGTHVSKCSTIPSTCGMLYCVASPFVEQTLPEATGTAIGPDTSSWLTGAPLEHSLFYTKCADPGGVCNIGFGKYIAFGTTGSWKFKSMSSSFTCDQATLGSSVGSGCYFANYTEVGTEGQQVYLARATVAYGAMGRFHFQEMTAPFACNSATFGDPLPGATKSCLAAMADYSMIAADYGTFVLPTPMPVAYGANGRFVYQIMSGNVTCLPEMFGVPDPYWGVVKRCYVHGGDYSVTEGTSFYWSGFTSPCYASGLNGNVICKRWLYGGADCTNAVFGDPDILHPGVKRCTVNPCLDCE